MTDVSFSQELTEARALHNRGKLPDAEQAYLRLAQRNSRNVELIHLRGLLAFQMGRLQEALPLLQKSAAAVPDNYKYRCNYGLALSEDDQLENALGEMEAGFSLKSNSGDLATNLGNLHRLLGDFEAARRYLKMGAELSPADIACRSNELYGMLFDSHFSDAQVGLAHCNWGREVIQRVTRQALVPSERDPERRLRLGFVSSDLREHAVVRFFSPLLETLDRVQFEIFGYSSLRQADVRTMRLKDQFAHWRQIEWLDDEAAAALIAEDRIDVLVDLNGHTADNRLMVFARRPAPIQLSYLGYPNQTGLPTIDYRISDQWADPEGSEFTDDRVWRLPRCAWCFQPDDDADLCSISADGSQTITFGSFNQRGKICPETVALWARVLRALPESRLLIKARPMRDACARYNLMEAFLREKIDITRISMLPWTQTRAEHLRQYGEIDIALDTYPYHGTTTTCEALWMGVPVITRMGTRHSSRVGGSLLHACGMGPCVAATDDEFVAIAERLARNPERIRKSRSEIRRRMEQSPLMDRMSLAQAFGEAVRTIWREYCAVGSVGR